MSNSTRFSTFLFIGSFILFTCGLSHHELTQFETRFGYFAQAIDQYGFSVFPLLYGKPYPDYPATYPILIYLSSLIFGKLTLFSAVLPSAINAAGTVVLTYRLGALHKKSWGMAAVLFEFATFYFLMTARSLSLDQFVLFATTLSFYLIYRDAIRGQATHRKGLLLVFIYGFIFRGFMGILIPLAVVMMFDLLNADYKKLIKVCFAGIFLLLLLNVILLLFAYQQGGMEFVSRVVEMQGLSRIRNLGHYPFYFYFQYAWGNYAITFPCAVLVIGVYFQKIFSKCTEREFQFLRYLTAWIAIILIGLSIPTEKKFRYILPIVPALSLLSARVIVDNTSWVLSQFRSLFLTFCFYFPLIALALVGATEVFGFYQKLALGSHPFSAMIFLILIFIIGINGLEMWDEKIIKYNIKLAMGVGTFFILVIFMVQPIHAHFNRTSLFADQVSHYLLEKQKIIFYKIGPDAEDIKLMVALDQTNTPLFISEAKQLVSPIFYGLIVSRDKDYEQLPLKVKQHLHVLYRGKIGHQSFLLLRAE